MLTNLVLAAVLPTWAVILIVIGVVLLVGALGYVVFRWGLKNKAVAGSALSGASAVFSVLQSVFKDRPDELDAHDFMRALESLSNAGIDVLKKKEAGVPYEDVKADMKVRIREIVDSFPQLKDEVTDELIEKATDAFFTVVGYIPKVNEIVKK